MPVPSFSGGIADPNTGLIKFGERWYDPQVTVWISADSAGFRASDTNQNRYTSNAPTKAIDPSGLATAEIGASVDVTLICIHVEGEVGLYGGFSTNSYPFFTFGLGGTVGAGPALGFGGSAGVCGALTNATNVGALEGEGHSTGVNTWLGGANYISGDDYGGIELSTPGPIMECHHNLTETGMWNTGPDGPSSPPDWVWPWDPNASWNRSDTWNLWFGGGDDDD